MSLTPLPPMRYGCAVLLAVVALALLVPALSAAEAVPALPAVLPAFDLMEIVHDRSRLIQFSVAAVALGIGLLFWGQKT